MNEIERFKKILGTRELLTTAQLVKLGVFGCRAGVYRAAKDGKIAFAYTSNRRLVIFKESLLEYLQKIRSA